MNQSINLNLADFYTQVQESGKLLTPTHAQRWSTAVLNVLGLNLDRGTKKQLAKALPLELGGQLNRVFWLLHFRDPNLSLHDFLEKVSTRSGNTDVNFAKHPTKAVFVNLKRFIDPELNDRVAQSLSPELSQVWRQA